MPPDDPRALLAEARERVTRSSAGAALAHRLADALEAVLDREAERVEKEAHPARCTWGPFLVERTCRSARGHHALPIRVGSRTWEITASQTGQSVHSKEILGP